MLITFFPFPNSSEIFPTYSTTQLHIFFLLKKNMGGSMCMPSGMCGGQRVSVWNLPPCGFQGPSSGLQACQQVPLPS